MRLGARGATRSLSATAEDLTLATKTIMIGLVAPRSSQALDVVGPVDAFSQVNRIRDANVTYALTLLATEPGPITTASGIRLLPDRLIDEVAEPFDTLLVAGSPDYEEGTRSRTH